MPPKTLRSADLQAATGLSRASISRLAAAGDIPGGYRHDGCHLAFPDSPALQAWILQRKKARVINPSVKTSTKGPAKASLNALDKSSGIVTIEGISAQFDLWLKKVSAVGFPDEWDDQRRARVARLLEPMAAVHKHLVEG